MATSAVIETTHDFTNESSEFPFVYRVDYRDRLTYMNEALADFADRSGSTGLAQTVIGKSLWDYIEGPDVQHVYGVLMRKVRSTRTPAFLPFRCDLSDDRRFVEMVIMPLSDGGIEFRTRLLDDPPQHLKSHQYHPGLLDMCATCKKVNTPSGWLELETAIGVLDYFHRPSPPGFSHGLCDDCYKVFVRS